MQFYSYRFMIRDICFNHLLYFRNLLNQFAVDMMAKMLTERLSYIRNNLHKLRADSYIHLRDSLNQNNAVNTTELGQIVILPSSFTGSPRYMVEKHKML